MTAPHTDRCWTPRLLCAALLWLAAQAGAQGFGFTPTVLTLDPTRTLSTQTTMLNTGRVAAKFRVEVRAWKVVNGAMVLQDTRDLVVNPTEFVLPGGGSQVVRVGLRKKPGAQELTFRLIVQQQPYGQSVPQSVVNADGIDIKLDMPTNYSLPVYVAPPSAAPRMTYDAQVVPGGVDLRLENAGTRHETFNALIARRGGLSVNVPSFAVLGGARQVLQLEGLEQAAGPLTLSFVNAEGKASNVTIPLP
ncbi:molecular chaperone [Deinococcus depolymerans]|uniref:Molecular chaperone n=1 Tax=Deinococcus depolymerans TaxID=392408 RepID=A0ABP3M7D9_9DEIO